MTFEKFRLKENESLLWVVLYWATLNYFWHGECWLCSSDIFRNTRNEQVSMFSHWNLEALPSHFMPFIVESIHMMAFNVLYAISQILCTENENQCGRVYVGYNFHLPPLLALWGLTRPPFLALHAFHQPLLFHNRLQEKRVGMTIFYFHIITKNSKLLSARTNFMKMGHCAWFLGTQTECDSV
jgi:hypothetical protein